MKYYKYSRKDWLDYYEDLEHMHITKEAKEDLLAKESNEEYSQRIMMEQVPKQEDNKGCKHEWHDAFASNNYYCSKCGKESTTPSPLEIEEIEEIKRMIVYPDICEDLAKVVKEIVENQNTLISNQKKLYQLIKEKL